jgi:tetratricopeptide (TPR) repeat protein/transcriptional regulator with XRE-family HTH domain
MVKKAAQSTPNRLLRNARLARGWTQKDVADRIGAPLDLNVTRWERGFSVPSAFYAQKLCQLFDKSPAELGFLPAIPEAPLTHQENTSDTIALEHPWNVPFVRNPFFTDRTQLLQHLYEHLNHMHSHGHALTHSHALTGLGGIGKSQIAIEYAYRFREQYRAVFWVRAASRETLVADFVALAHLLSLPGQDEQDQLRVVSTVKRWLEQQEGWLLIFDNADEFSVITEFLPKGGAGHILLTSRAQATGTLAQGLSVEKLAIQEGTLLLLRRAKLLVPTASLDDTPQALLADAQTIVEALDGLPLAIDQAGAYIEEVGCSLSEYLALFQRRRSALLNRPSFVSFDYPYTVASTWSLSFQKVEQTNPAAAELLRLCAFLDPDYIPEALLTDGAAELSPILQDTLLDPLLLHEAIQVLRRYSLIKRDPVERYLNMHRLVQLVLKDGLDESTQRQWAERTIRAVNRAFPEVALETWAICERCLPHVHSCVALIDRHSFAFPEAARLLHYAGWYLRERGLYEQSAFFLHRALNMREQLLGSDHPDTATTLHVLARLYQYQGKYDQAASLFQRALAIREQALGRFHMDTVDLLNDLGAISYMLGNYDHAEAYLQRAFSVFEQSPNENTFFADTLNNLAMLYQHQHKYDQAEPLSQRALSIYQQVLGHEHPYTLMTLNNLAYIYYLRGNYAQAERSLLQSLGIQERTLGSEHPDVAVGLNDLASVYRATEQYDQSTTFIQRALSIAEQSLGPQHPTTATILFDMACLYEAQQQNDQAILLYRRVLTIREQTLGPQHPSTVEVRKRLSPIDYLL